MRSVKIVAAIGVVGVLVTAACGESARSANPVAPSAVVASEPSSETSAEGAESGTTGKPANPGKPDDKGKPEDPGKPDDKGKPDNPGNGHQPAQPAPAPPSITAPLPPSNTSPSVPPPGHLPTNPVTGKVELEGLIDSISEGSITVKGHAVAVPGSAVIRHGSHAVAFSDLQVGDQVHVRAWKQQDASLAASEIKLQDPVGDDDDDADEDDEDDPDTDVENADGSVWVALIDGAAAEAGLDTGTFRLTRVPSATVPLTSPLTVNFTLTGTALNGTDYQAVVGSATFLAGDATVDVVVRPLADALVETPETVILTVIADPAYAVGTPSAATVTIGG